MRPARSRRLVAALAVAAAVGAQASVVAVASAGKDVPPPTPVPPNGSLSPFPTVLHTPADGTRRPEIDAPAALLADLGTGQLLVQKAPTARRPIASLTKVMTALVTLAHREPTDVVRVAPEAVFAPNDYGATSTLGLRAGERLTIRQLLEGLLLGSANDAAVALAIDVAGSEERFEQMMNARATSLGMRATHFESPNGLDDRGRSTARDLLVLAGTALDDPVIAEIVRMRFATIPGPGGTRRHVQNRNVLLWLYPGATGMKTGSTALAGACLIASAERGGRTVVSIVLGAPREAFSDAAALLSYGFEGFERRTFVTQGEALGEVRLHGGSVPVVAAEDLSGLLPIDRSESVRRRIVVDPGARFPPRPGDRVATLRVSTPGSVLGSAGLVVSEVPGPAPASGGSWWSRAGSAVSRAVVDTFGALLG